MSCLRQLFPAYGTATLLLLGIAPTPSASTKDADGSASATIEPRLPADWRDLPALAERAHAAATRRTGENIELAMRASGDPASGAFAMSAWVELRTGGAGFDSMPAALRAAADESEVVITDWRQSRGDADFTFEWRAFRGTARVRSMSNERDGSLRATLLTCFYNERQPSRSAQACLTIMEIF